MQERIKFPKSFDFSTPFQGQKEETAHASALHNEAIADDDLLSIKPPSTKTPEKNCTKLFSFSTGCKKSFEIQTPKLREFPKSFDFSTPFQGQKEETADGQLFRYM